MGSGGFLTPSTWSMARSRFSSPSAAMIRAGSDCSTPGPPPLRKTATIVGWGCNCEESSFRARPSRWGLATWSLVAIRTVLPSD